MTSLTKNDFTDVEIVRREDHYILRNHDTYFKLGIPEGELLEALASGMDSKQLEEKFHITSEDLEHFISILQERHLIGASVKSKQSIFFLKFPLFSGNKPMQYLAEIAKAHKTFSQLLLGLAISCILVGLVLFGIDFREIFKLESVALPIPQYILLYVLLFVSIALHEIAHGFVCALLGCRVEKMGIMLIFFSPALYCDISGIRMEVNRYKQILTSSAGLLLNLFLVSISAILFHMTNTPFWASFLILNLSIIYSNILPLIKLDGYWILSFATGITNLYQKSIHGISLIWRGKSIRERLLGLYGLCTVIFAGINILALLWSIKEIVTSYIV